MFGETVTFGRLLERSPIPQERLALLASNLEDQIATVFRQIAMNRFEHAMHTARRDEGELSVERLGELWADVADARCSATRSRSPRATARGGRTSRTSSARPATCTRTRYGQLLALSVYAQYEDAGSRLRAAVPRPVARRRIDVARGARASSSTSISPIPGSGTAASTSSSAASTRRSQPRAPVGDEVVMTYRVIQWSTGNVGVAALRCIITPSRPRARRRVGALGRQGRARTRGSCAACRPPACSRRTTSTRCSRSTPTACRYTATADLRPLDAINDMARILASGKNVVSSSVVAAIYPPHLEPSMRAAARRRVRDGRRVVLHVGHRSRVGRTTSLPLLLTGTCEYIEHAARDGDRQLQATTSSRRCCSTRWASARRSTRSRCC